MTAADALRDLQVAAVLFTVQLATSNGHGDPATLQQLEDKLAARLERQDATCILLVHDDIVAAQTLAHSAINYTRQIIIAENSGAPIGSTAMERAINDLRVAAIAFTVQVAISEGHDPKALRRIEKKLIAMFTRQGIS